MFSIALNLDGLRNPSPSAATSSLRSIIGKNRLPIELIADSDEASYSVQPDPEKWLRMILRDAEQILERTGAQLSARPVLFTLEVAGGHLGNKVDMPELRPVMFTAFRHREGHEWLILATLGVHHLPREAIGCLVEPMRKIRAERPVTKAPKDIENMVGIMASAIGASMEFTIGLSALGMH